MRTVKEISELTGISVRTLHYYDEIGLLKPTEKSDAGYRLYDDKALETLQQILFFREFDIPLKEIKAVMDNPVLERNQLLQMQRKMLVAKKERMERLITSIDDILKGENKMDFAMNYKLRKEEITTLVEAPTPEEFRRIFNGTYYGKKYEQLTVASLEEFYNYILRSILEQEARKDPYSVAVIYSYLYHKEHEVNRLTIALECVRYGVDPEQSLRYIRNG